jgi:hypothetical protein
LFVVERKQEGEKEVRFGGREKEAPFLPLCFVKSSFIYNTID